VPLAAGQSLSFYEILGSLGAGAMGEVYHARDTRLDRDVAIKVLPEEFACEDERLRRFEREAKTLASLNHPNIAQVFGIDQVGDMCFIAMEFVPGEDLDVRLTRGALAVADALDVGRQIAEGVEAAHEAGVVHRDLKPANVVLTPEGRITILDFGLAKPAVTSGGDVLTTEAGRVLGTPTYMAPEQARGRPIDKRVDVWAFGCVLYECLTGRRAFAGDTVSDVLAAVLESDPDWARLPRSTPESVRALLARCLDKDPRTRLRDVGEARIALARGTEPRSEAPPRRSAAPIVTAAVVVAVAAIWLLSGERSAPARAADPLAEARIRTLVHWPSAEIDADLSPAGDVLVFGSDRDGALDLWVAQIDAGRPENLTQGRYTLTSGVIRNLGFDHDGSHVWFLEEPEPQIQSAPRSGGDFEPLLEPGVASVDWSRDGSRIVYHVAEEGDPIHVRGASDAAGEPILAGHAGLHQHFPTWSFDDEWIFVVRGRVVTGDMQLWRVRPDGGALEQLTFVGEHMLVGFPTPIDSRTVLFVAQDANGAGPWLWSLDLELRETRRIAVGTEHYTSLAASADGRRLVAAVADPRSALWIVPIGEDVAREEDVRPVPGVSSVRAMAPRYALDSGDLFYLSSRGAGDGLWMQRGERAKEVWSANDEPVVFFPSVSPDGRRAAVVRRRGSRMVLSVVSVLSAQTLVVFDGPVEVSGGSSWSPDGDWIVVGGRAPDSNGQDVPGLFRFPAGGGAPQRLVAGEEANDPVWSPQGDLIVYCGPQTGPTLSLRAVRPDGTPVELAPDALRVHIDQPTVRFLPDGNGLVFMEPNRSTPAFQLVHLASGRIRRLIELDDARVVRSFDVRPDGDAIVFDRHHDNADVVLIDRPEPRAAR